MQLRSLGGLAVVASVAAAVFNLLSVEFSSGAAAQGLLDGVLISLPVGGYLIVLRDGALRPWLRRWNFAANLGINSAVVLTLFLVMRGVGNVLTSGRPERLYESFFDAHLLYATPFVAACALVLTFVMQMNRMVGTNVVRYFLAGVYHRPVEEERIFMFLDLVGSTQLAEQLGSARYYDLLRRFVDDLTEPILATGGEIYQYAGDEVVVTWRFDRGCRGASCVRCFFLIQDAIEQGAANYRSDFGVVPRFRAGLHGGTVTAGELGDLKQEIVFVGDILNTAARLEELAKQREVDLVASGAIIDAVELPEEIRAEFLQEFQPRGKQETLGVHSLVRSE